MPLTYIWNIIDKMLFKDMRDHYSYVHNLHVYKQIQIIIKHESNSGLNRIWTHDLCYTSTVLYQSNYQANGSWSGCELLKFIPLHVDGDKWNVHVHGTLHIWTVQ